ncbi:outer membrane protein assembly factor BamB family protein [Modestobacter roseus]|uniref:Putative pyrroloquinoline-quinone binding quinoprotein n=1 Tax=Modestobacter roseus TaxID=1181884 RepID=A0A562ITA8_9ACTN|nr:PQQ-binding-like beta-propeller repeat protein [Modestobacter roseus]MQA35263.1 PQQ-binding-like beta-propeller repeat protein [Modestobacter roseus]TWH74132.1 putative pyrroloquinoline-quinone binding quinoprotein [Modestobacter roseus]
MTARGRRLRPRPPLRVWVWTAAALVVAAVAVSLWLTSDVAATSSTTAPPASVADEAPAGALTAAWSAPTDGDLRGRVVESGRVLVTDEHGVAMVDPATGEEAWHYRRSNARLCDATAVDGLVIVAFRTTGRCNELTGLTAATGERAWYRNVRFRTDVDLTSTEQVLLASSPTGIVTIDPTGDNTRWRVSPADGCRFVDAAAGSTGVAVLQRCGAGAPLQVLLYDGMAGDLTWTRELDTGTATARLTGADRLVGVVVGDTVTVLAPADGATLRTIELPSLPAGADARAEPLLQAGVEDVALLWARGTVVALDQATGATRWSGPALGLPAAVGSAPVGEVLVPEDGAFVRRSLADGAELERSTVTGELPTGGRATVVGPTVVLATPGEVRAFR